MTERLTCADCGAELPIEWIRPPLRTNVCPKCGSEKKKIYLYLHEEVQLDLKESLDLKTKDHTKPSKKNPRVHLSIGDEVRKKDGKWLKKERRIDKNADRYRELLIDPATGEVLRDVDEPLSKHTGHGSAKCNPETTKKS